MTAHDNGWAADFANLPERPAIALAAIVLAAETDAIPKPLAIRVMGGADIYAEALERLRSLGRVAAHELLTHGFGSPSR